MKFLSIKIFELPARGYGRYKVEIAALTETRLAKAGLLKEVGAGYTFFLSGRKKEERREAGVGFAIKSHLVSKFSGLLKSMDSVIYAAPRTDKLILLGDFNARVGTDHQIWEGVIGSEGVGKCNSNVLLLLKKCAEYELLITNTVFRLPTRRKTSWMHPRSKHWHLIDCVVVRRKDRQDVSDKDYVGCRLLDRSQASCQQTQPAHSACTTTTRQEGAKQIGCLQAEETRL